MSYLLRKNAYFFLCFCFFLIVVGILLLFNEKGALELAINREHQRWLDVFFKYLTHVGDGLFYVLVIVILLIFRRRQGWIALVCFAVVGASVQFLKKLVFYQALRPKLFFGEQELLHFVEGVSVHSHESFPSGHAATAFSVFCLLSLFSKNPVWGLPLCILAILAACSRVYLLQHFILDIYVGAILGTILTLVIYHLMTRVRASAPPKILS